MLEAELGVQVTRVHDPERAVRALRQRRRRSPPPRSRSGSRRRAGPRAEGTPPAAGARPPVCSSRSRRRFRAGCPSARRSRRRCRRARVDHHLVERPRDRRGRRPTACRAARESSAPRIRGVVGLHPDVDQVDVTGRAARPAPCCRRSTTATSAGGGRASAPRVRASASCPRARRPRAGACTSSSGRDLGHRASRPRAPSGRRSRRRRSRRPGPSRARAGSAPCAAAAARPSRRSAGSGTSGRGSAYGTRAMIGKVLEVPGWDSRSSARSASSPRAARPSSAGAGSGTSSSR